MSKMLYATIGFIAGGIVSYVITNKMVSDKYKATMNEEIEKRVDEEMKLIKEYYNEMKNGESEHLVVEESFSDQKENKKEEVNYRRVEDAKYSEYYELKNPPLEEVYDNSGLNKDDRDEIPYDEYKEDEDEETEEQNNDIYEVKKMDKNIKLVRADEFDMANMQGRVDCEILYYYAHNDVLTDEEGEIIEDEDLIVGNCLDKFQFRSNDEIDVYIHNQTLDCYYKVHKIFSPMEE